MIYDVSPINSYQGNSVSTTFDFDFYIEDASQLNVFHYNKNGYKAKLVNNVDYSIHELKNKNGSYITFPLNDSRYDVLSDEERIVLQLTLEISQETEYNNSSLLNLEALEYSFDYLTRLIQILSGRLDSCLQLSDYTSSDISELIQQVLNCASAAQEAYENIQEYGFTPASESNTGVVKIGSGINVDEHGLISVDESANLSLSNINSSAITRFQYVPFAINYGSVSSGLNNSLTYSGSTVTCSGCTITTPDGRTVTDSNSATLDVSTVSDGSYYIFKNYSTGALSLVSNLTIAKTAPSTPSDGDYWLDISTIPANLKIYDTSDWTINNDLVYIGDCSVESSGVSGVSNREFNNSGYAIQKFKDFWLDYNNAITISTTSSGSEQTYTCPDDGMVFLFSCSGSSGQSRYNLAYFTNCPWMANSLKTTGIYGYLWNGTASFSAGNACLPFEKGTVASFVITQTGGSDFNACAAVFVPFKRGDI